MTKSGLTSNEMEAAILAEVSVSFHSWAFGSALGELRGTFGVHVARIAAFRLDMEDRLASVWLRTPTLTPATMTGFSAACTSEPSTSRTAC
ncbi:MAG: hypothetical protein WBX09_09205 [Terracidiphilus sp.]